MAVIFVILSQARWWGSKHNNEQINERTSAVVDLLVTSVHLKTLAHRIIVAAN